MNVINAGLGVAFGLPQSPGWAILFLLVVLAATYAFLTRFIRVETRAPYDEDVWEEEAEDAVQPEAAESTLAYEESLSVAPAQEPAPSVPPPPVGPDPLEIEAVRVKGIRLALGDTSSHVMSAFRPGEGETTPFVERNERAEAARIVRTYMAGRQPVTLTLERATPDAPLVLTRIAFGYP